MRASIRRYVRSTGVLLSAATGGGARWFFASFVLQLISAVGFSLQPFFTRNFTNAVYYHHLHALDIALFAFAIVFTLGWGTVQLATNSSNYIAQRSDLYVGLRISELINAMPGIEQFERPEYLRELDLLNENRRLISQAPQQMLTLLLQFVRGGIMIALLANVHLYYLALPLFAFVPFAADSFSVRYRKRIDDGLAETRRLANALYDLTSTAAPAKELRVFGLRPEIRGRHDELSRRNIAGVIRAGFVAMLVGALGWLVFAAAFVGAVTNVVIDAVNGQGNPGTVVMVVLLILGLQFQLSTATPLAGALTRARKEAERFVWLADEAKERSAPTGGEAVPVPGRINEGITFDHVTFRYPGTEVDVLRDVSLRLPAGAAVAIVGENGAGKTTMVKLLGRLYEPTSGAIRLDGSDLTAYAVHAWREAMAATFQDFSRYELRAGHAVGVGDLPLVDDDEEVLQALTRAGAADLLDRFPEGLDTQLGRSFENGRELSGGEWQKIALGRGRMRAKPLLLVLDEPTSSLDAPTEHALFERYVAAAKETAAAVGTITVLVSHRFSTVRIADLIIVIADGAVSEFGTHQQLMVNDSTYAELYRLQSSAYA